MSSMRTNHGVKTCMSKMIRHGNEDIPPEVTLCVEYEPGNCGSNLLRCGVEEVKRKLLTICDEISIRV